MFGSEREKETQRAAGKCLMKDTNSQCVCAFMILRMNVKFQAFKVDPNVLNNTEKLLFLSLWSNKSQQASARVRGLHQRAKTTTTLQSIRSAFTQSELYTTF